MKSILSDSRFLGIALAITFALIYVRIFENNFFEQIIIISIPSILGLFGSKWIANSWQIHKDKIKMKEDVLLGFDNSAKNVFNIQENFVIKLITKYGSIQNSEKLIEEGTIDYSADNYPLDVKKQPRQMFFNEYKKVQEDLLKVRYDGSHFMTLLKLYYHDETLSGTYLKIQRNLRDRWIIVEKWMDSKTSVEFITHGTEYQKHTDKIRQLIHTFDEKLIVTKLYNIPV